MVDTTSLALFIYTLLAKITSIRLLFILFISSVTKEFKSEYLSISVFTVLFMGILAVFNFHFVLPYLNIIGSSVLARFGVTFTNKCNFVNNIGTMVSYKGLLEGIYNIINAFPLLQKIFKIINILQGSNTTKMLSTFRLTYNNPFINIPNVIPLTKLSKFTSINIAEIIPNKLNVSISYKGNANDLTLMFRSFVAEISNLVSSYSKLDCNIHLTCPGEKITIHSVFENGNLQEYSFDRTPVNLKNKSSFYSFYNGKDRVKELLAFTDPSKMGSNLPVFMQKHISGPDYPINPFDISRVKKEHFFDGLESKLTPKLSHFIHMSFASYIQLTTVFVRFDNLYFVSFLELTYPSGLKLKWLFKDRLFVELWPCMVNAHDIPWFTLAPYPFDNFNTEASEWVINESYFDSLTGRPFSSLFRYFFYSTCSSYMIQIN